ncbi:MAG: glycosyltransferase [Anaerolineae bacterium]|nr:glycosyltransferase [Anaerolineae bacterium]
MITKPSIASSDHEGRGDQELGRPSSGMFSVGARRPKVSVVTPSYNQAKYLEETIVSVLDQSYPGLEYVIMDGGSADGSVDIIRKYADRLSYWVSEPDAGQADAINKGIACTTGDIVAYLNSDDVYLPDAVASAVATFQADSELSIVHGDALLVDSTGKVIGRRRGHECDFLESFLDLTNPIVQPSTFVRRKALEEVDGLDTSFHMLMDYDLWARIALRGMKIRHIRVELSLFRVHDESKTRSKVVAFAEERRKLVEKCLADPSLAARLLPHRKQLYAVAHLHLASAYWLDGQSRLARDHYRRAVSAVPRLVVSRRGASLLMRFVLRRRSFRSRLAERGDLGN